MKQKIIQFLRKLRITPCIINKIKVRSFGSASKYSIPVLQTTLLNKASLRHKLKEVTELRGSAANWILPSSEASQKG